MREAPVDPDSSARFPVPILQVAHLPMLCVGRVGLRRVGLVVLDRRRRVRCARLLDLRRRRTTSDRIEAVRCALARLVREQNVAMVVLEAGTPRSPSPSGFQEAVRLICEEEGAWMHERSVRSAFAAIGHDAPKSSVLAEVATSYRELAARLDFRRPSLFRHRDHERDVRPLVNAFVLAHAVSLEAARAVSKPIA